MTATTDTTPVTNGHHGVGDAGRLRPVQLAKPAVERVSAEDARQEQFVLTEADAERASRQVELQGNPALVDQWTGQDFDEARSTAALIRQRERDLELAKHAAEAEARMLVHRSHKLSAIRKSIKSTIETEAIEEEGEQERRRKAVKHARLLADKRADQELWEAHVEFADKRMNSPMARRAEWAKRMSYISLAVIVGLIAAVAMTAVFVQDGIALKFPKLGLPALIASYGMESLFSVGLILVVMITTAKARRGHLVNWWLILPIEVSVVGVSVIMTVAPRLAAGMGWSAWLFALPPFGVTVMLAVHVFLTQAEITEAEHVRAEAARIQAEKLAEEERLRATEEWQRQHAIAHMDPQVAERIVLADKALAAMELPETDPEHLAASQGPDADGLPSQSGLEKWMRAQGVHGGRPAAIELRNVMGWRRALAAPRQNTLVNASKH